jgi:hypothetical protein
MKRRCSFVTNSSSASFIVKTKKLSEKQILEILNPEKIITLFGWNEEFDIDEISNWRVSQFEDEIHGVTFMDNFDYLAYLRKIGIKDKYISCN